MTTRNKKLAVKIYRFLENLSTRYNSERIFWFFLMTILTVAVSFVVAFWVRFEFTFPHYEMFSLYRALPVIILLKILVFYLFRLNNGLWRYVSISDLMRIFFANVTASVLIFIIVMSAWDTYYFYGLSRSVLVLDFLICFFAMSGKRVLVRVISELATGRRESAIRTLIIGSAESANGLIHAFAGPSGRRHIVGVMCDDIRVGRTIRGVPVVGTIAEVAKYSNLLDVSEILLLPPYSMPNYIKMVMEEIDFSARNIVLRMVPAYTDIANGSFNISHIKEVEIEDLLGRKPIKMDNAKVSRFIKGKSVMITGAGGSIGSELCRQIAAYQPSCLVLFEISEFNLYQISMEIWEKFPQLKLLSVIGDVRSERAVTKALLLNKVNIVYHAAAYKHVPLMEENPIMAFKTNVIGSSIVANACEKTGILRMVLISTDKAVGPTSVMGASKRLAERVILERESTTTEFVAVRFGNVLGSSGSVIPLFKRQIKAGGPVTVTSRDITRYFMSIPEAVDLVLQAGVIAKTRSIMVLEMGEPVKIYDMAKKLIKLSGLRPEIDIKINFVGLRAGEKEYEELLTDEEKVDHTSFEKIFIARKNNTSKNPVDLIRLKDLIEKEDTKGLREFAKENITGHKLI